MKVDLPFVAALLRVTILGRMVKRAGINTEIVEVAENTEKAPRRAGARAGWRGIMLEDSAQELLCQTITLEILVRAVEKRRNGNGGCGRAAVSGPPAAGSSEASKKKAKSKPAPLEAKGAAPGMVF